MTTNKAGTQRGRRALGSHIEVNIGGVMRSFPGQIKGLSISNPATAQAGADTRQVDADGTLRIVESDAQQQQQRTITLQTDLMEDSLDYKAIAALEGETTQMSMRQRRDELVIASPTSGGNTVAITTAFVPTFSGTNHPGSVPELSYIKVGGKVFRIRTLGVPNGAGDDVDLNSSLHELAVTLDREGMTNDDAHRSGDEATLTGAVAASVYSIVSAAAAREWFAVRVLSAPLMGDYQGGGQDSYVTGNVVLELVGANVPPLIPTDLPVVS